MSMLPPIARRSPATLARELIEPARIRSSPSTGAAVITEPPSAKKSPATGAVSTTEAPTVYEFPGEELAAMSDCAAEKEAGATLRAAEALVGRRHTTRRMRRMYFIVRLGRRRHLEMGRKRWFPAHQRKRSFLFANRFNEAREHEDNERDESGRRAIDTECAYEKYLQRSEVERSDDSEKRGHLKDAAQEPIKEDEFERGEYEKYRIEKDAELGKRNTEDMRVWAVRDDVAAG